MKKWLITGLVVLALGVSVRWWLRFLPFFRTNSDLIQGLSGAIQIVLWLGAGLAFVIGLWRSRKKAQDPPVPASALHQLPPPPLDFTGRAKELAELTEAVEKGGVTISGLQGLGGVGKTALALKLAAQLTPRYPDAQLYLDLKGVSKEPLAPKDGMEHVIRAYRPDIKLPDKEGERSGLYRSLLHNQRAILLMDNAKDAHQVAPLIPPPSCLLLVTSRQHFPLPGCVAKNLDALPPADARAFLLQIAPRLAHDGGDYAGDLARLCGYLPLALRSVAGALAARSDLSPADYVRKLKDARERLKLTEVGASLGLSYELLAADRQKQFCALAVFPDTFEVAGAAAVWEAERETAQEGLGELLLRSLPYAANAQTQLAEWRGGVEGRRHSAEGGRR